MVCKMCETRGKTWNGDDPRCAFRDGAFTRDNFQCATATAIRNICDQDVDLTDVHGIHHQFCDDEFYATINVHHVDKLDKALALWVQWYKRRGRTQGMLLMFEIAAPRPPTEQECLDILKAYNYPNMPK